MKTYSLTLFLAIVFSTFISFSSETNYEEGVRNNSITNLYDAFAKDSTLTKDFGFSCITKYQGKTILFDAGSNAGIFKENVENLGIDLRDIDMVIISHGHFDHLNGIDYEIGRAHV